MRLAMNSGIARLYKYRSLRGSAREHTSRIFTHNEIFFSSPLDFNDPFEAKPRVYISGTTAEVGAFIEHLVRGFDPGGTPAARVLKHSQLEKAFKKDPTATFQSSLQQILNDYAVFSLTEDPLHPLMWSHYSDSHQGICIEFDASKYFFNYAHPIDYKSEYPVVDPRKHTPEEINRISILTKADFWGYEKEWRIIFPKMTAQEKVKAVAETNNDLGKHLIEHYHNGPGLNAFPKECLAGVILGARISEADAEYVSGLMKEYPHARVYRAVLDNSAFRLHRESY